jgi:ABC-2 type transport system permease protein
MLARLTFKQREHHNASQVRFSRRSAFSRVRRLSSSQDGVNMRLYWEIAVRSFRRATTYRTAYIAGMITNAFFGAIRCFVYVALYANGGSVAGFTLADAISYTWITQALISIGAGWISGEIGATIRSGDVVTDLQRPWHFYGYWLSRLAGERVFNLLVRGTLTYALGVVLFSAHVPSFAQLVLFSVAAMLALLVIIAFTFIVNLSAFWLLDNTGVASIANVLIGFFGGFSIPIAFFPAPLAAAAQVLPFQAMSGLPAQVLIGQLQGAAALQALVLQLFWAVVLTLLALWTLDAALRKVVVQGG